MPGGSIASQLLLALRTRRRVGRHFSRRAPRGLPFLRSEIHSRPLSPGHDRWPGLEPDPHDLLITYPSEQMTMWPISTRVNKPENDDPSLLDRVGDPFDVWAPLRSEGRA